MFEACTFMAESSPPCKTRRGGESCGLSPALHVRPERLQILLQPAAEQHGPLFQRVGAFARRHDFARRKIVARRTELPSKYDDDFSLIVARSPEVVVLVPRDRLRQSVARPEKIDGRCFAVVVAENRGLRLLLGCQRVIRVRS